MKLKALVKYILLAFAPVAFLSCEGNTDADSLVPEGTLRIFADKTTLTADGKDEVVFRVMWGQTDVTGTSECRLVREYDGEKKYMPYGENVFTTSTPGVYTFKANYYKDGNHESDNSVEITAEQYFSGEARKYRQRVLALMFTSTECTSCPSAAKAMKSLQEKYPGLISAVAVHTRMLDSDPMEIEEAESLKAAFGVNDLPRLFWNMRGGSGDLGYDLEDEYKEEVSSYEPSSGVALETSLNDDSSEIEVKVKVTSNVSSAYRYVVFIVEDGIDEYGQMDNTSTSDYYVHDNVLRDMLSERYSGDKLNEDLPLSVGVEVCAVEKVSIPEDWDLENVRVVAASLLTSDDGRTYHVDNVAECRAGGSVDYEYVD